MVFPAFRTHALRTILLCIAFITTNAFAADPQSGSVDPSAAAPVTWVTNSTGVPAPGGESTCVDGTSCDVFVLTVAPGTWTGKRIAVSIRWTLTTSDYDLFIHKDSVTGPAISESAGSAPQTSENTFIDPNETGAGVYYIHVANFAGVQPTDQPKGSATVVSSQPPAAAPQGTFPLARYQTYRPPVGSGLGLHAGEPSIGVNPRTGKAFFQSDLQTLRVTFLDNDPARALWENKSPVTSVEDSDPILFTDQATGRTFVSMLLLLSGQSEDAYTDDDGNTWIPQKNAPTSAVDHQTEGAGPYKNPTVPNTVYPNAVYYCSQDIVTALCSRSDDGGLTFGPTVPMYTGECGGLHGHVKVAPSGTVYVPNKACLGGEQGFAVSFDNGNSWTVRTIPGTTTGNSDPSIGIGANNRVYMGFANNDRSAGIAYTDDEGLTWSQTYDVGASFGIHNIAFPEVTAGDNDRAAYAFLGTPAVGDSQDPGFGGVWHMYVAHTYDGGSTWQTVDATPNDAVQRGPIWFKGGAVTYRNLLDFNDAQHDAAGNVVIAMADGCAGANCNQASATAVGNSYTQWASIIRQTGGLPLFKVNDKPATVVRPGTPSLTVLRVGKSATLNWSLADNGGAALKRYRIFRGTASGAETALTTVAGTTTRYTDTSATNTAATYYYKVTAENSAGQSIGNNEVAAPYHGDTCVGVNVAQDPTGDQTGAPANPDLDVQSVTVSEPTADTLKFVLKVNGLTALPNGSLNPDRKWLVSWNYPTGASNGGQYYVGMITNSTGVATFEYGTIFTEVVGLLVGRPQMLHGGAADPSSNFKPDGTITIVVPKSAVGSPKAGDLMGAVLARTYADPSAELRSTLVIDSNGNGNNSDPEGNAAMYTLAGTGCTTTTTGGKKK